jgi:hypothetical protein
MRTDLSEIKCTRLLLLSLLSTGILTGCATGNPEDDAFFNRGWLWPRSLDQRPDQIRAGDQVEKRKPIHAEW